MKKWLSFTLILLIFAFACQNDIQKSILGQWEIVEAKAINTNNYLRQFKAKFHATKEQIDLEKSRINSLPSSYYPAGIIMEFGDSSNFYFGGANGRWKFLDKQNLVEIELSSIDTTRFLIKKIDHNSLIMIEDTQFSGIPLKIELKLKRVK